MRRLFDDNDNWTEEAREISPRISDAIRPIVEEFVSDGVSVRDLELIFSYATSHLLSELKVKVDLERRRRGGT